MNAHLQLRKEAQIDKCMLEVYAESDSSNLSTEKHRFFFTHPFNCFSRNSMNFPYILVAMFL